MASVRKRGKSWQVRVNIKGHVPVTGSFPTKRLANEFAAETEAKIYRGIHFGPGYDKTLNDTITYYLERVAPTRLSAKTIATHQTALSIWRESEIGSTLLPHITAGAIADVRDRLCEQFKNVTVNRYTVALSAVLSMAEEREWIAMNPCRKLRKLPDDSKREVYLNERETAALLHACEQRDRGLYLLVLAALETGARRGELEGLLWDDIDMEAQTITFRDTKNGDTRTIPLPATLSTYLGMLRALGADRPFQKLRQSVWNAVRRLCDLSHVRFHDLRHTFATTKVKEGHSIRQIAAVLGHRDLNMMMRYAHVSVDDLRGLVT